MPSNKPLASVRLYVGSLPYSYSVNDLRDLFAPFGQLVETKIVTDKYGKNRGWGYVQYQNLISALDAKKKLHQFPVGNRTIIVDFATPDPAQNPKPPKINPPKPSSSKPKKKPTITTAFTPPILSRHLRQSVFNSRYYGARVGAKFARRQKLKSSS